MKEKKEIKPSKYTFRKTIPVGVFLELQEEELKKGSLKLIELLSMVLIDPPMTQEDLLKMDLKDFIQMTQEYFKQYDISDILSPELAKKLAFLVKDAGL